MEIDLILPNQIVQKQFLNYCDILMECTHCCQIKQSGNNRLINNNLTYYY